MDAQDVVREFDDMLKRAWRNTEALIAEHDERFPGRPSPLKQMHRPVPATFADVFGTEHA